VSKALMTHCFACPKGPVLKMPRNMRSPKWGGVDGRRAIDYLKCRVVVVEGMAHDVYVFCEGLVGPPGRCQSISLSSTERERANERPSKRRL
jgi:hypothetical protein